MNVQLLPPRQLSEELRTAQSPDLKRRRAALALSFAGAAIGGIVGAYQLGLVKHLPEILPGKVFDSDKVDASDHAYQMLQMPDAPLMLVNYGVTASLIAAGGADRAEQNPTLPIAAAVKSVFDLIACVALGVQEWRENKKLCSYCQTATLMSAATVALTLPEALRALRGEPAPA